MSGFGGSENFFDSAEASEDDGMVVGGRCRGDIESQRHGKHTRGEWERGLVLAAAGWLWFVAVVASAFRRSLT